MKSKKNKYLRFTIKTLQSKIATKKEIVEEEENTFELAEQDFECAVGDAENELSSIQSDVQQCVRLAKNGTSTLNFDANISQLEEALADLTMAAPDYIDAKNALEEERADLELMEAALKILKKKNTKKPKKRHRIHPEVISEIHPEVRQALREGIIPREHV